MPATIPVLVASLTSLSGSLASVHPVRIPPYFDSYVPSNNSSPWIAPPPEFYAGTWGMRNVSNPILGERPNLQWDVWLSTPTCLANSTDSCPPSSMPGQMIEITTWSLSPDHPEFANQNCGARAPGDREVASFLGHHTPRQLNKPGLASDSTWDGVWDVIGTDGYVDGFKNQWAVLAWGTDARGDAFAMIHEDASTANGEPSGAESLDLVTRSETGADPESLAAVLEALDKLGDKRMSKLVKELAPTVWDVDAQGGAAICAGGCLVNQALRDLVS